jgi:multiple sugar transport system substrate-binding protein
MESNKKILWRVFMQKNGFKLFLIFVLLFVLSSYLIAEGQGEKQETAEITYWTAYPGLQETVESAAEMFMKENPNITVDVVLFPQRAMNEKVAVAVPAGEGADLIDFACFEIYPYYVNGYISNPPDDVIEMMKEQLPSFAMTSATAPMDGEIFCAPYYISLKEMFYNKDHFADAGLNSTPKTLEEQIEYAKKLTKMDAGGNIQRVGLDLRLSGGGFGTAQKYWTQVMVPYGCEPIKKVGDKYTEGYANKAGYDALQYYMDAVYKHKVESLEAKSDAEGFGLGLTSMFQRESWVVGYLKKNAPDINYGIFLMPKGPANWGTVGNTQSISVPASSENKRAAWDFAKYLMSPEIQVKIYEESGWQALNITADYSSLYDDAPVLEDFIKALDTPGHTVYDYKNLPCTMEVHARMADRLMAAFKKEKLATDRAALEAEVNKMAEESKRILDDYDLLAK